MKSLQFMHASHARSWGDDVLKQGDYFVRQGEGFYTLGMPAYCTDKEIYPALANMYNRLLTGAFYQLHNGLISAISTHFGERVGTVKKGVLLPGFHIFDSDVRGEASMHTDTQYENIAAFDVLPPDLKHFTFTVPLRLPSDGVNGLIMWHHDGEKELVEYREGRLYIFDGSVRHQIKKPAIIKEGDVRITLQGHGVHTPEGILLYW